MNDDVTPDDVTPDDDVIELATRVFTMAREGQTSALVAYVDAGIPVDLRNDKGDSLVMFAAYHGHADTVSALVTRGADVDLTNDRGQTPLAGAVFKQERDVIEALLDAGADPNAGTPSALATAQMFADGALIERLGGDT